MPHKSPLHEYYIRAPDVLDAVEAWATSMYVLLREREVFRMTGRMDGILVPVGAGASIMAAQPGVPRKFWGRPGLVGVEVKVSREDFLRGLRKGQFERYAKKLSGLYVAAPRSVFKTNELPDGVGHLVIGRRFEPGIGDRMVCICRRHPRYVRRELKIGTLWRVLFEVHDLTRKRFWRERKNIEAAVTKFGHEAGEEVMTALRKITKRVGGED